MGRNVKRLRDETARMATPEGQRKLDADYRKWCEALFKKKNNPLDAWRALLSLHGKDSVPLWVRRYLAFVAREIASIGPDTPRDARPIAIARALGLAPQLRPGKTRVGGTPDAFDEYYGRERPLMIALDVQWHRRFGGPNHGALKHESARLIVQEAWGISRSTVDRAWKECRSQVEAISGVCACPWPNKPKSRP
jgi:hypothetical protein